MNTLKFATLLLLGSVIFACNSKDDNLLKEDNIDLNSPVETVVASEEMAENVMESADYETDLYSFAESSLDVTSTTKSGTKNPFMDMFGNCRRYKDGQFPDVNLEFSEGRFPITITLDYGDSTILNNGHILSGIMQIVISAPCFNEGASRTIRYNNFAIDTITINGEKIVNFKREQGVSKEFHSESQITYTFPDNTKLSRTTQRTRKWVAGLDTPFDVSDDSIDITGFATCLDSNNNEYTKEITTALKKMGTCKYIVSGIVTFSQNRVEFANLNYGDGECDDIAMMTTANGEEEIVIGKHHHHRNQNRNQNGNGN